MNISIETARYKFQFIIYYYYYYYCPKPLATVHRYAADENGRSDAIAAMESCVRGISNWMYENRVLTEWSTIQGVIARVISKSDERVARGRFEITSSIIP